MSHELRMGNGMEPNVTIIPLSFIDVYHDLCMSHELRMGYGMEPNITIVFKFFCVYESRSLYESRTQNVVWSGAKCYNICLQFCVCVWVTISVLCMCHQLFFPTKDSKRFFLGRHKKYDSIIHLWFAFGEGALFTSYIWVRGCSCDRVIFFVNTVRTPTVNYKWK